jgi:O-acetyl-ADP-ribose deacetylase (regulator of RNase III)
LDQFLFHDDKGGKALVQDVRDRYGVEVLGRHVLCMVRVGEKDQHLEVCLGDLQAEPSEAIINPANSLLQHRGGAARAIADACGADWEQECHDHIAVAGPIEVGGVFISGSGDLRASSGVKHIVNAVGPSWNDRHGKTDGQLQALLQTVVVAALVAANDAGCASASLNAISTGIFGGPTALCARIIVDAVRKFFMDHPASILQRVSITNNDTDTAGAVRSSVLVALNKMETQDAFAITTTRRIDFQWSWQENATAANKGKQAGDWIPYDPAENGMIELQWEAGASAPFTVVSDRLEKQRFLSVNGERKLVTYTVSLANPDHADGTVVFKDAQMNDLTKWTRSIRRQDAPEDTPKASDAPAAPLPEKELPALPDLHIAAVPQYLALRGLVRRLAGCDYIAKAEAHIQQEFSRLHTNPTDPKTERTYTEFKLTRRVTVPEFLRQAVIQMSRHGTELVDGFKGSSSRQFETVLCAVCGTDVARKSFEIGMREWIGMREEIPIPDGWVCPQPENLLLVDVTASTHPAEFQTVMAAFLRCGKMGTKQVAKVQRVQNEQLWEKFQATRDRLRLKLGKEPAEHLLFHGTSSVSPDQVYDGEHGFDMRWSRKGMWGRASYFAVDASYSDHSYAFETGDGHKQLFLANVIVGDHAEVPYSAESRQLKVPPERTDLKGFAKTARYDSVKGHTGSDVFMVYGNCSQAYPSYVITYKCDL